MAAAVMGMGASAYAGEIQISVKNSIANPIWIESQVDTFGVMIDPWPDPVHASTTRPAKAQFSGIATRTALVYYSDNPSNWTSARTCQFRWETDARSGIHCEFKLYAITLGSTGTHQCSGTIVKKDMFKCTATVQFEIR